MVTIPNIISWVMIEIPYRECAKCGYIEECPSPFTEDDGSPHTPRECPKAGEIKLTPKVRDIMPREYFNIKNNEGNNQ